MHVLYLFVVTEHLMLYGVADCATQTTRRLADYGQCVHQSHKNDHLVTSNMQLRQAISVK